VDKLIESFHQGDPVALGRLLREVENQTPAGFEILRRSTVKTGHAHIVGITGPPGAGKSTLVGQLCKAWAAKGLNIGVICVDPTSPFTGGALLGDRIRMQELSKLPDIFIKSLATRGNHGGIAASTADIVRMFDAFGKDIVLIETVGVGQVEYDVMGVSDTVVLVNVPGLGDSLQTMKAGIMEIADLYVINQADRAGAEESVRDLQMMIHEMDRKDWEPPVLQTIATQRKGTNELVEAVERHRIYLKDSNLWKAKRQERNEKRLQSLVEGLFSERFHHYIQSNPDTQEHIQQVRNGELDPYSLAPAIIEGILKGKSDKEDI
jgi:LAO/AO transport system kinase